MAAVGRVGVSEFVDDDECRPARQSGVEIEFHQRMAAIGDWLTRQNLQPLEKLGGLGPAMRFDQADDNVLALAFQPLRLRQHGDRSCRRRAKRPETP